MQFWEEGPDLPIAMDYGCAVSISSTTFLIISKRDVREFDAAFDAGKPTSDSNWMDSATWPQLQTERWYHPGCAVIGKTLVIAGGFRSPVSTAFSAGSSSTGSWDSSSWGSSSYGSSSWGSSSWGSSSWGSSANTAGPTATTGSFRRNLPPAYSTSYLASLHWCSPQCNVYRFRQCCNNPICFGRRRSTCRSNNQWTENMRKGEKVFFQFHWDVRMWGILGHITIAHVHPILKTIA